jgi:hypothetical protein
MSGPFCVFLTGAGRLVTVASKRPEAFGLGSLKRKILNGGFPLDVGPTPC